MAICIFGGGVTGIRGTVGGLIFSANQSGPYIKSWARSTNPKTIAQSAQRGYVSEMPALWRSLTAVQQAAWDTWAALPAQALTNSLGQTYYISGWLWFEKLNTRLRNAGLALQMTAPANPRPASVSCNSVDYSEIIGGFRCRIYFTAGVFGSNSAVVFMRPFASSGRQVCVSGLDMMGVQNSINPAATWFDYHLGHALRFGTPQDGWVLFTEVYTQSTEGLRSTAWVSRDEYVPLP